jgi:hypothetical protein
MPWVHPRWLRYLANIRECMNVALWSKVDSHFRCREFDKAAQYLESLLRATKSDRFASLCELRFTNTPASIASHIEAFIALCAERFSICAIYVEMNGFDINYDRWYFDSFAYDSCASDPDELDWLCNWRSAQYPQYILTGLERIQDDFRWYMEGRIYDKRSCNDEEECAVLLVMTRFVQLIRDALALIPWLRIPVLATAHDFDIVARFESSA